MKKIFLFFLIFLFLYNNSYSQELYINTEAASLIPKGTKVIRFNYSNIFLNQTNEKESVKNALLFTPSLILVLMDSSYIQNKEFLQQTNKKIILDYLHL